RGVMRDAAGKAALPRGSEGMIHATDSRVHLHVIPTNEELLIARDTVRCIKDAPRRW
ncbi:MAG: acetate kinase, partial [Bacteroidota bacterium]